MMGLFVLLTRILFTLTGASHYFASAKPTVSDLSGAGNCSFPSSWRGKWFLQDFPDILNLNETVLEGKGECQKRLIEDDLYRFLMLDRSQNCQYCLVATMPHPNVIQYKESYCMPLDSGYDLQKLCSEIGGDATLNFMFRIDPVVEECPFSGRYAFTYTNRFSECKDPVSFAESCARKSEMRFHYKSCPDISEQKDVTLECVGNWRSGDSRYLVGRIFHNRASSNEERFRCFIYRKTEKGIVMSQSDMATCTGLYSPTEGPYQLTMTSDTSEAIPRCRFPVWLTGRKEWVDMGSRFRYLFDSSGTTFRQQNVKSTKTDEEPVMEGSCLSVVDPESMHVGTFQAVVLVTLGCTKGYMCTGWRSRDDQIIQTRRGRFAKSASLACSEKYFGNETEWTTLVSADAVPVTCPFHGNYLVATPHPSSGTPMVLSSQCSQTTKVTIGCGRHDFIQLQSHPVAQDCPDVGEYNPMHFACHGHWMEDQVEYIVATDTRTAGKHCFTYKTHASGSVLLSSTPNHCPGSPEFPSYNSQFNVTEFSSCADAYSSSSPSRSPYWQWKFFAVLLLSLSFGIS